MTDTTGADETIREFCDAWQSGHGSETVIVGGNADVPYLFLADLRAVLDEREQLVGDRAYSVLHPTSAIVLDIDSRVAAATARAEKAEAALERVRQVAAHPRSTQGSIRGYVYAADILTALDQPKETGDGPR